MNRTAPGLAHSHREWSFLAGLPALAGAGALSWHAAADAMRRALENAARAGP